MVWSEVQNFKAGRGSQHTQQIPYAVLRITRAQDLCTLPMFDRQAEGIPPCY